MTPAQSAQLVALPVVTGLASLAYSRLAPGSPAIGALLNVAAGLPVMAYCWLPAGVGLWAAAGLLAAAIAAYWALGLPLAWAAVNLAGNIVVGVLWARSLTFTTITVSALKETAYPLFVLLFSWLIFRKTGLTGWQQWTGAALVLCGMALLVMPRT